MKYLGAHVSAAGGVENAPLNAHALGANAFALFTKNQRQWQAKPLSEGQIALFRQRMAEGGFSPRHVLPHDSYLINLGHPEEEPWGQSLAAFIDELERCRALGLDRLNFHPGSHLKALSEEQCLDRIARAVNLALERVEGVTAVIENTAGQGSNMGYSLEHLAGLIERIDDKGRVGVCLDTCHLFAAGYDLLSEEGWHGVLEDFERLVGFRYLRGVHLNDSKCKLGGRVDRHHSLGEGELGWEPFRRLMNDPRFDDIPMVLETIDESRWADEIRTLRGMIR
ncbi:MAG: deoxyribonuclease IV [Magnetococcales bacterium]|nr:deoxyribonuclease IV [Magnetococcales bacterium]